MQKQFEFGTAQVAQWNGKLYNGIAYVSVWTARDGRPYGQKANYKLDLTPGSGTFGKGSMQEAIAKAFGWTDFVEPEPEPEPEPEQPAAEESQNEMEYHFSASEYVGTRSDGTVVYVDESAFAETIHDAVKAEGLNADSANYDERYAYWREYFLNPNEWFPGDHGVQTDEEREREAEEYRYDMARASDAYEM